MAADLGRVREALVRRVEGVIRSVHQLGSDVLLLHASDGILTELQSLYQVVGLSLVYGEQGGTSCKKILNDIFFIIIHAPYAGPSLCYHRPNFSRKFSTRRSWFRFFVRRCLRIP